MTEPGKNTKVSYDRVRDLATRRAAAEQAKANAYALAVDESDPAAVVARDLWRSLAVREYVAAADHYESALGTYLAGHPDPAALKASLLVEVQGAVDAKAALDKVPAAKVKA